MWQLYTCLLLCNLSFFLFYNFSLFILLSKIVENVIFYFNLYFIFHKHVGWALKHLAESYLVLFEINLLFEVTFWSYSIFYFKIYILIFLAYFYASIHSSNCLSSIVSWGIFLFSAKMWKGLWSIFSKFCFCASWIVQ